MSCCSNKKKSESACCTGVAIASVIGLLVRWAVIALGVYVAAHTSKGISYNSDQTLVLVVLVLSLLNLFIKPLLVFFTFPLVVLSLGAAVWLINAGLLMLTAHFVPGFVVDSFLSALWGALVISALSLLVNALVARRSSYGKEDCGCGSKNSQEDEADNGPSCCSM